MIMSMVFNVVLLPKCGGTYNQAFLTAACNMTLLAAGIGTVLVCLGVSAYDKPETFVGTKKSEPLKMSDIVEVLKNNRPCSATLPPMLLISWPSRSAARPSSAHFSAALSSATWVLPRFCLLSA